MNLFDFRKCEQHIYAIIGDGLDKGDNIKHISDRLKAAISVFGELNNTERQDIFKSAYFVLHNCYAHRKNIWKRILAMRKSYDEIHRAVRKAYANSFNRWKKSMLKANMSNGTIFYMCSIHNTPAADHKDYQGKVYVNRFWRQFVNGDEYTKVLAYIRNHNVKTLQWVMDEPVYLTTRPYCKHYFIPLATSKVLKSSTAKLQRDAMATQSYTSRPYTIKDYYKDRNKAISLIPPCQKMRKK